MKFYCKCFNFRLIILNLNSINLKKSFYDILKQKTFLIDLFRRDFGKACINHILSRNLRNFAKP